MPKFKKNDSVVSPYKLKGSPMQRNFGLNLDGTGVKTTMTSGSTPKTDWTLNAGAHKGGWRASGGITNQIGSGKKSSKNLNLSYDFGKGNKKSNRSFDSGFQGKAGVSHNTKSGTTASGEIGFGGCGGGYCKNTGYGVSGHEFASNAKKNIGGYGKYNFKNKSTEVGVKGSYGALSLSGGYNLKTKKPTASIGLKFGK